MSAEENKALWRRYIEEMDKGNTAIVDQLVAANCVVHYPGGLDVRGPEALKEHAAKFYTAFPDFLHTIEDMIAEGDKVAGRFTNRGTHKGEFMGIAPTGKQVRFTAIGISLIAEGKFVETWIDYDALGLMQQLGAVPPLSEE